MPVGLAIGNWILDVIALYLHDLRSINTKIGWHKNRTVTILSTVESILKRNEFKDKPFIIGGDFDMIREIHFDYNGQNVNKKQSKLSHETF